MGTRAAAVPRLVRSRTRRALNGGLDRIEVRAGGRIRQDSRSPAILIVGAPRCGSTLLYQLVARRFDVTYLSNLHCAFFGAPSIVERVAASHLVPPDDYASFHGATRGRASPSECGPYWYRFFRKRPQYVPLADADPAALARLADSYRALSSVAGRPVVFKNLLCSLRLAPIAGALPDALFVVVRRDLLAHARSLLRARKVANGNYTAWFSAEPPDIEALRHRPPEEAVVEQIRSIERVIEADRSTIGRHRFHDLRYEDLCATTGPALDELAEFAGRNGCPLRRSRAVPDEFAGAPGSDVGLDPSLDAKLRQYVSAVSARRA